jgi:hypothetical protein
MDALMVENAVVPAPIAEPSSGGGKPKDGSAVIVDCVGTAVEAIETGTEAPWDLDEAKLGSIELSLPETLLEELRYFAECEQCEVSELVLRALNVYLADHWIRDQRRQPSADDDLPG